ncbi:unnamed protein product [Polarella glacialis]|uniref:Uncharacterized protein n=1 Tax=Polarella glacialis TaxID=89957 RepID=A0A813HJU3_POLGL|nr:unnamed protein product [Polarella glacialis]
MAPMKRPAAASAASTSAAKKRNTGVSKKLSSVAKVLKSAPAFPKSVLAMLGQNLGLSLGPCKEERHEYQERIVQMLGEVINSVESGLQAEIQAAQQKVAAADGEKARREAEAQAADADVLAKTEAVSAGKLVASEKGTAQAQAAEALATAKAAQKAGDASLELAVAKKDKLVSVLSSAFLPLKEGSAESAKEAVAAVTKLGKEFSFDGALLTSLPSALTKPLAERGSFDTLVIDQVEAEIQKYISGYTTQLSEGEAGLQERATQVSTAFAEQAASSETLQAAQVAFKNAQAAQHEAEINQKLKHKELKQFGPEMKQIQSDLREAQESLSELQASALADFKELAERSIHPPEPEPVVEPVVVEVEAPAPAAELPIFSAEVQAQ